MCGRNVDAEVAKGIQTSEDMKHYAISAPLTKASEPTFSATNALRHARTHARTRARSDIPMEPIHNIA